MVATFVNAVNSQHDLGEAAEYATSLKGRIIIHENAWIQPDLDVDFQTGLWMKVKREEKERDNIH